MDYMPERDNHNDVFHSQERFEWYQVNTFLQKLGRVTEAMGVEPADMIHLGGTANFYRCYDTFGPMSVSNFRGTHDMDIISFKRGTLQNALDRMQGLPDSPLAEKYLVRKSHLPDKRSYDVGFKKGNMPGLSTGFEIDVYEPATRAAGDPNVTVRFNDRVMTPTKLIMDAPEQLILPGHRGVAAVPSLRDSFIIKMDIIDYSLSGLRPKDNLDILVTMALAKEMGVPVQELIASLVDTAPSAESVFKKLSALEALFRNPMATLGNLPTDYPFLPDRDQIGAVMTAVLPAKQRAGNNF